MDFMKQTHKSWWIRFDLPPEVLHPSTCCTLLFCSITRWAAPTGQKGPTWAWHVWFSDCQAVSDLEKRGRSSLGDVLWNAMGILIPKLIVGMYQTMFFWEYNDQTYSSYHGETPKDEATLTRPEDSWVLGGCLFPQSYANFIGNLTHPRIEW